MKLHAPISLGIALMAVPLFGFGCNKLAEKEAPQPAVEQTEQQATSTQPADTATTTQPKPTTTKPKTTTAPPTTPVAKTVTVNIIGSQFSPQIIAVSAGDTVVWVNKDTLPHTTKSDGSLIWDSGTIRTGSSYKRVFNAPGSYKYSCAIHPAMHGTVIVR